MKKKAMMKTSYATVLEQKKIEKRALRLARRGDLAVRYDYKDGEGQLMPKEVSDMINEIPLALSKAGEKTGVGMMGYSYGVKVKPDSGSKAIIQIHLDVGIPEEVFEDEWQEVERTIQ